ncbi:MAG TPA: long-chain fatty acid--CoA ligase [Polyangiaceae bacterium]|nr:long-chain fatty acid--CoA ligase [Polyangiaceae bacterium]
MPRSFSNLVELYQRACQDFAHREVFGVKHGDHWDWLTYAEFGERVDEFRAGLAALGIGPGDRIGIVANNCVEWAVAAYATYGLRAAFVPMYEAQHADEWVFILKDCAARAVIGSRAAIFETLMARKSELPALEHVIGIELPENDPRSFAHVSALGRAAPIPAMLPAPGEIAGFIYTSGTTGQPKGVVLTHKNFVTNVNDASQVFPMGPDDRALAFLYWAHAFGQTAELHQFLSHGLSLAINDDVANLVTNLAVVRPTILVAVPRIFNRIYDGITKQMAERPAAIQALFRAGLKAATRRSRGEKLGLGELAALKLADSLIFRKVRARLGGRLKFCVSGSAALSKDVAEFVNALGIDVYEGYGLSEASPVVSSNYPGAQRIGSVGKPFPSVRVVIDRDVTGDPVNGEIVVYGDNVMQGYHNRPEENAQTFTADGGLRTGDMGHLDEDGYLFITGRIKEQYKLENGKYTVPSPLEEDLKLSPYIANVMLYGENKPFNVAIVVPDMGSLERWAKQRGEALGDPVTDPKVKALLQAELDKQSAHFKGYERPKKLMVVLEDFTVENGILTPSLKIKRREVVKRYGAELEALYR